MEDEELLELKRVFEERLEDRFPLVTQLPGRDETVAFDGGEYLV
jgi:hypothetical protein